MYSFGGKLHIGFVDIRTKLESILEEREARRVKRREEEEKVQYPHLFFMRYVQHSFFAACIRTEPRA